MQMLSLPSLSCVPGVGTAPRGALLLNHLSIRGTPMIKPSAWLSGNYSIDYPVNYSVDCSVDYSVNHSVDYSVNYSRHSSR